MKRLIAFLLSALVLSGALFSCSQPTEKGTASNNSTEPFAKADYSGEEFTFLVIKHTETIADYYGGDFIDADTYTGDTVNDKVYERNLSVEERYNVKIEELATTSSDPEKVISSYRLSGDICFDVVYGWGYKLCACIPGSAFCSFSELEGLDLSREWWAPSATDDLTVGKNLYVATNDITMNRLKWAEVILYNNTVAKKLGIEDKYGSPLSLVTEGKWTYDIFLNMISDSAKKGSTGLITNDAYGTFLANGADVYYTQKTASAIEPSLLNDKLLGLTKDVQSVFSDPGNVKSAELLVSENASSTNEEPWDYALSVFSHDGALFYYGDAHDAVSAKAAGCDYSILPVPKYDEEQKSYNATVSPLASMFAVLSETRGDVSNASRERTGIILDYMAYKSRELLYPEYANELLYTENGGARSEDLEVLSIIRDSTRYEFSTLFGVIEIHGLVREMFKSPENAESIYKSCEPEITEKLDDLNASLTTEKDKEK